MAGMTQCLGRAIPAVLLLAAAGCERPSTFGHGCGEGLVVVTPAAFSLPVGGKARVDALASGCLAARGYSWRVEDGTIAAIESTNSTGVTVVGRHEGRTRVVATSVAEPVHAAASMVTVQATQSVAAFPITGMELRGTIDLAGRVVVRGDTLLGTLLLTNPSKDTARVDYGACSVGIRAYASAALAEPTPWLMSLPANSACIMIGYRMWLAGGATDSIVTLARQGEAIPRLPAGHYWFALVINPDGLRLIRAGEAGVP